MPMKSMDDWKRLFEKYPKGMPEPMADELANELMAGLARLDQTQLAKLATETGQTVAELKAGIEDWKAHKRQ